MSVSGLPQSVRRALRSEFLRHSALVFAASMGANVFNYLFNVALTRRLGVEGYATLSALISFLMIMSIPTSVLALTVVKYAAVYHATDDGPRMARLSSLVLRWAGAAGAVIFGLGLLLVHPIAAFLRIEDVRSVALCLSIVALGVVTPSVRAILQGEQDFARYSASTLTEVVLKLALSVPLVYMGFGVAGAMAGWALASACAVVYTAVVVLRKHRPSGSGIHLGLDIRRLVQTTAGVGFATALLTMMSFMDVLFVKHYFDARTAGFYAALNLTGKVVLFLVGFVPAVVLPKAVAKNANGENASRLLLQAAVITLVMSGLALMVFGALPGAVLRVLAGRDFVAAAPFVLQYDGAMCMLSLITLVVNYKIGVHEFEFLYVLAAVLFAEVAALIVYHPSLAAVVHILLAANAIAIVGCVARSAAAAFRTARLQYAGPEAAR